MTTINPAELQSFSLDHLGIVAGIIDDIDLVEILDNEFGNHPQEAVSSGVAVKAMILNGLGFVSAPLYLFERFFHGKPTEHLLGKGITPEHLSDDKLGKVLDKLHDAGLTRVFVNVALHAAKRYGVTLSRLHLDASSFHVHGRYENEPADPDEEDEGVIHITHGYSREKRPDLKQFLVDLMASNDEVVPVFFDAASGNQSDTHRFAHLVRRYRELTDLDALFIADSALYSEENLQALAGLRWVTRVPLSLKEAKRVLDEAPESAFKDSSVSGYRIAQVSSSYAGIEQRWLIIDSDAARDRTEKGFERNLERQEKELTKDLRKFMRRAYHCQEDAVAAAKAFAASLTLHQLTNISVSEKKRYLKRGRPTAATPFEVTYHLTAKLERASQAVATKRQRSTRFILATNVLGGGLSNDEVLRAYKDQQVVERGFRFLRDPMFFTSSVFIKSPARVAALAMIMALSLLVYSLGQRLIRQNLAGHGGSVPNQKGKPTSRPTLRWVFQLFMAVHLLRAAGQVHIMNLSKERKRVLEVVSPACRKYYLRP